MKKYNYYKASSGGMGFVGVLATVFVVLKLLNVISWSWLWVLSPIWISAIYWIIFMLVIIFLCRDIEKKIKKSS